MLAVGKGELYRLDDQMQVFGAVVFQRRQVVTLQDVDDLRQERSLAPGAAAEQAAAGEIRGDRRRHRDPVLRQIALAQQPALGLVEGDDPAADVAAVEGVAGRSEERRVGKEGVSTCRSRWSPYH